MTDSEDLEPVGNGGALCSKELAVVCAKGLTVGAGLHLGQLLVSGVTSGKLLSSPGLFLARLPLKDTVRFAAFIAAAGGIYKLTLSFLRKQFRTEKGWPAVVAGFLAGLVSCIDHPGRRHTLSLFILARALGALVFTLHTRKLLPTFPHFVILTFGLCQSFILYAAVNCPSLLPVGYYRSVISWSHYFTERKIQVFFRSPSPSFIPCSAGLHQGSCLKFALTDFFHSLFLYLRIYGSIYSLPLVLFRTRSLLTHTASALSTLVTNTAVSALFLATDCTIIKYCLCLFRNLWGSGEPFPWFLSCLAGFLGVAGLLIERQSRRLELLYYVLPQVFYGFWRVLCIKKPLNLHKVPWGSVWVIAFSMATIMHAYEREPLSLSPLINRALHVLLDT